MASSKAKHIIIESAILGGLALAFGGVLLGFRFVPKDHGLVAALFYNQVEKQRFALDDLDEQGIYYTLQIDEDEYLKVHAKHQGIAIIESTCPGQDCVHQGYIGKSHEIIACAHYGVYISFVDAKASNVVEI